MIKNLTSEYPFAEVPVVQWRLNFCSPFKTKEHPAKIPEGFNVAAIKGEMVAKFAPGNTTGSPVNILLVHAPPDVGEKYQWKNQCCKHHPFF